MDSKTKLWDVLCKTDPSQTKPFKRAGGFSGTAIKPIWAFKRMTEEFGPVGIGWGTLQPVFQVVSGHNNETLVYCTAGIWHTNKDNIVYGVGGDKVTTHIKANEQYKKPERWENDDEAFKKSYTDALTNALKLLGVGADVHMGLFDDSKYVNSIRNEFAETAKSSSVFDSIEMRTTFVTNCIDALNKAPTMMDAKDQKGLNLARWNAMSSSEDEEDRLAFKKIAEAYNAALAKFKALAEANKQKPDTVERAMHPLPADVLNDEIRY